MIKFVAAGFASALSFVLLGASPGLADRTAPPSGAPTLKLASQVGPSHGGPSGLPRQATCRACESSATRSVHTRPVL